MPCKSQPVARPNAAVARSGLAGNKPVFSRPPPVIGVGPLATGLSCPMAEHRADGRLPCW